MLTRPDTHGRHRRVAEPGRGYVARAGNLAAATVVAGAGVFGAGVSVPSAPRASAVAVQHEVELAAFDWGPFLDSLQSLFDRINMPSVNDWLALLGTVPGSNPDTDFSAGSTLGDLLNLINPSATTFEQIANSMGVSLNLPLYSGSGTSLLGSTSWTIGGTPVQSPLLFNQPPSFFTTYPGDAPHTYTDAINGTPLGNLAIGRLVDMMLGGANEGDNHSLADLADQMNFDLNQHLPSSLTSMLSSIGWLVDLPSNPTYGDVIEFAGLNLVNYNEVWRAQGPLGGTSPWWMYDRLNEDSSVNDWVSALLGVQTRELDTSTYPVVSVTAILVPVEPNDYVYTSSGHPIGNVLIPDLLGNYGVRDVGPKTPGNFDPATASPTTLGQYLQSMQWGDSNQTLAQQNLATLLGIDPDQSWTAYLAEQAFGGIVFHPSGEIWGGQTLGDLLSSFLPEGSTFDMSGGTANLGDYLAALLGA